jgi:hypothetical protein
MVVAARKFIEALEALNQLRQTHRSYTVVPAADAHRRGLG